MTTPAPVYIVDDIVTDAAALTPVLLEKCTLTTTFPRLLPKSLGLKDSDTLDYYSKQLKVTYPDGCSGTTVVIPGVVFHYETFDHYGKTGVYVGVPQSVATVIKDKLKKVGDECLFEEPGLASDAYWWWTRCGFSTAEAENEYICMFEQEGEDLHQTSFSGFAELFNYLGSSVVATITCTVKMSTKVSVESKGALSPGSIWKMGLTVSKINVTDISSVAKPKATVTLTSEAGPLSYVQKGLKDLLIAKRNQGQ